MIGQLHINGVDVFTRYSIKLAEGAHSSLLQYPALKTPKSVDWSERNGKDYDLSDPKLNTRNLSISLGYVGVEKVEEFIQMLSVTAYHIFEFKELGRTYKLRLVSHPDLSMFDPFGLFTLQFADDFPLRDYTYLAPLSNFNTPQGYEISYITLDAETNQYITITNSLSDYGVYVMSNTDSIEKMPNVKPNLLRNINSQHGVIYDDSRVVYQTKDVAIDCFMRANTLSEFWRNYDALLYDLTRPKAHDLHVTEIGKTYLCFYKSSSVQGFYITEYKILYRFTITLTFTSGINK